MFILSEYKVISLLLIIKVFDGNDDDDDGFNGIIISYWCEYVFFYLDIGIGLKKKKRFLFIKIKNRCVCVCDQKLGKSRIKIRRKNLGVLKKRIFTRKKKKKARRVRVNKNNHQDK